jgi:histidinol-phosphate aminotransferase
MTEGIEKYVRLDMSRFGAYSACKSPDVIARKLGIPEKDIIKLDANENPYGCSPKVRAALADYPYFNIYPDSAQTELLEEIAAYVGLDKEFIVAGNGSDELIDLLLRLLVSPGEEVITTVPTFDMYRFCTQVCCGKVVEVVRKKDFGVDVAAIKAAVTPKTRLIFITNPNNPTGTVTSEKEILELVLIGLPLVVDEAYYEFCGQTAVTLVPKYPNLMVLRTFSKWAGLAGLRVGYGIFPRNLAEILMKVKPPYSVNLAASVAVRESLKDRDYLLGTVAKMKEERERLFSLLKGVDYLKPIPSRANFVLCEVIRGNAYDIQDALEKRGILVRYYNNSLLKNYIRISVGKPRQTDRIIKALNEIGEKING